MTGPPPPPPLSPLPASATGHAALTARAGRQSGASAGLSRLPAAGEMSPSRPAAKPGSPAPAAAPAGPAGPARRLELDGLSLPPSLQPARGLGPACRRGAHEATGRRRSPLLVLLDAERRERWRRRARRARGGAVGFQERRSRPRRFRRQFGGVGLGRQAVRPRRGDGALGCCGSGGGGGGGGAGREAVDEVSDGLAEPGDLRETQTCSGSAARPWHSIDGAGAAGISDAERGGKAGALFRPGRAAVGEGRGSEALSREGPRVKGIRVGVLARKRGAKGCTGKGRGGDSAPAEAVPPPGRRRIPGD